jgi:hypothetical protein
MQNITEPATLVTDYLLAAFTAALAWKLRGGGHPQRWWAAGLAASSVAGLAGGTVHGVVRLMPAALTAALWLLTLEMLVLAGLAVTMATIAATARSPTARRAAAAAASLTFAAWAAWIPSRPVFGMAIAAYGASLVVLALVEAPRWWTSRLAASAWLLAGVALSVAAAAVQQLGWGPHPHVNHNDLFHVIQAGAVWLLYRGAQRLPDAVTRRTP